MKISRSIILFLCMFHSTQMASARLGDGIDISGMKLNAKTEMTVGYDDNILLERDTKLEDMFYSLRPYIDFLVPFNSDTKLYFSADADLTRFFDETSENVDSYVFLAGFDFVIRDFYGTLLEEYTMPEDRDGILFTNIIKRTNNVPSILLGFDFNKLAIEGLFRKIIARYDDPVYARDEYDQDDYMLTAYWHAFTKTDILLELNLSKIEYELPGRDGDYGQIMAGLKGQITSKIEGAIKAGYQDRTYKDSDEKYDEAVFEIDALWKISEDKTMDIKYLKTAKESLILGNNYYKVNRIYLDYSKNNPIRGILYGAGGFYENDDFPFTDNSTLREDDVFMIFVSAGFRFNSWLTLQAKYRYLDRNSNYDEQDYQQNVITCFATLQL